MAKKVYGLFVLLSILLPLGVLLYLKPFSDNFNIMIFTIVMIGFYFSSLFFLVKPLFRTFLDINLVAKEIKNANNLSDLVEIFNKAKELKPPFTEYRKTLRPIEIGIDTEDFAGQIITEYYSTIESEYFFNDENLIYKKISHRSINTVPQMLTGLGIFGTFYGITLGVKGLEGNLESSAAIKGAISTLLSGVEVSFKTSLYGIILSLGLTLTIKLIIDMLMNEINSQICPNIDRLFPRSTEKEGLKELEKQLAMQTASIQRLVTDLSEEMGKRFDQSLQENMKIVAEKIQEMSEQIKEGLESSVLEKIAPALEKLSKVSEELGNRQEGSLQKLIDETLKKIQEVLSAGTQHEITKLKSIMETIIDKNQEFMAKFSTGLGNLENIILSQGELIKGTNDSAITINEAISNFKELEHILANVTNNVRDVNKDNSMLIQNIEETFAKINEFSNQQAAISQQLAEMLNKSVRINALQDSYMEKFKEASVHISDNVEVLNKYFTGMKDTVQAYLNNFREIKDASLQLVEKLNKQYDGLVKNLEFTSEKLSNSIEQLDTRILARVDTISENMANLTERNEYLYDVMESITNEFANFAEAEKISQQLWRDYKKSFEELNQEINNGINEYTTRIMKGTEELFKGYDQQIANALKALHTLVDRIDESLENIADLIEDNDRQGAVGGRNK